MANKIWQQTHKIHPAGLPDFFFEKAQSRGNSGSISSDCNAFKGKIRQIRHAGGVPIQYGSPSGRRTTNPLHLSVSGRLTRQPALPARPKPLIFCGFAASGVDFMGLLPRSAPLATSHQTVILRLDPADRRLWILPFDMVDIGCEKSRYA